MEKLEIKNKKNWEIGLMKRMIEAAKKLKVEQTNKASSKMGDQYRVGEHVVRIYKKPRRSLISCTCENSTRYCNSPTICKHKLSVIYYLMKND